MNAALHRRRWAEGAAPVGRAEEEPPAALPELLGVAWRRKGLVFASALAAGLLAAAVLSFIPARYEAVAEVLVEPRAPKVLAFDEVTPSPEPDDDSTGSEVRMILSAEILGRAVDRLRLAADPEFNPEAAPAPRGWPAGPVAAASRRLLAAALGWRAPAAPADPDSEARAARALAVRNLRRAAEVLPVERSRVVAVRVASGRAEKAALIANTLVDLHLRAQLQERRAAAERAARWLERRLEELVRESREAAARVEAFRAGEAATAGFSSEAGAALLRQQTVALANARARGSDARAAALERASGSLRAELRRVARIEAELQRLEADAEAAHAMRAAFRTRLAETRAQAGVQRLDARIVAAAVPPLEPASPNAPMILALALAGGAALGAGLAAVGESRRAPLRATRQVEAALGIPVIASAPRAPGLRPAPVAYARRRPGSRLAEAARNLKTLFDRPHSGGAAPPQVIALASARPGEGKSTLAALLADAAARSGRRTLLIDCDLRRPTAASLYGADGVEDLAAVLEGEVGLDEAIRRDPETGVHLLPAEPCKAARSDLLAGPAFAALIAEARRRFDAIVLDTPPALALADARLVAAAADATVLAIRWGDTPREDAAAALQLLEGAGAKLVGAAFTRAGPGADHRIEHHAREGRYGRFAEQFED